MWKRLLVRPTIQQKSYNTKVIDHYENPRNVGSFDKKQQDVGTGIVGAPSCGDVMKLQIKVDQNNTIREVRFKTFGCGSAIASSSYVTELIKDEPLHRALEIKNGDISKHLNLPPVKLHCSMLAQDAIRASVRDFQNKATARSPPPPLRPRQ